MIPIAESSVETETKLTRVLAILVGVEVTDATREVVE